MGEVIQSFSKHVNAYNGHPRVASRPISHLGYDGIYQPKSRPVVNGGAGSTISLAAYLVDSANPATEIALSESEPDGVEFGYGPSGRKDIVFLIAPALPEEETWAAGAGNYMLSVYLTWATINEGFQSAYLYTKIGLRGFDDRWQTGNVCWDNRPIQYDAYVTGSNVVSESAGDNLDDMSCIVAGGGYTPIISVTPLFNEELAVANDELYTPWSGAVTLSYPPDSGFILSAYDSERRYRPPGWLLGDPTTIDKNLSVTCTFFGYKFEVEI